MKGKDQHMLTGCLRGFIIELFTAFISPVVAAVFRVKEPRSHFSSRDHCSGNKILEFYSFYSSLAGLLTHVLLTAEIFLNDHMVAGSLY